MDIEEVLSEIGAKIANATDLSRKARKIANKSESILTEAQQQIETIYVSLASGDETEDFL